MLLKIYPMKQTSSKYEPYTNLKSVKLTGIKKEVTDMSKMFYGCESLGGCLRFK